MQKILVLTAILAIALNTMLLNASLAQILITKDELPSKLGTTWTTLNDTTENVTVDIGASGENQTWNFTQSIEGIEIKHTIVSLDSTPFSSDFPESDFVIKYEGGLLDIIYSDIFPQIQGDVYFYQQITDTAVCLLGTGFCSEFITGSARFAPPNVILNFLPTQYYDTWNTKSCFTIVKDTTILGVPGQLKLTVNDSAYTIIDAWGKIVIPLGEFDCLRMKSYVTMNEEVTFNDIPIITKRSRVVNYNWITKNYGLIMRITSHNGEQNDNFTKARLYSRMSSFIATFNISGATRYYSNDQPVANATMTLDEHQTSTNTEGIFSFTGIHEDNYTLTPHKDDELGTSISAYDASLVLRYMVGLISLTPYQMIASDVSGNGSISAFDASYILRYVIGLITEFPIGDDWTFVPTSYAIDHTNWHAAPNYLSYTPMNSNQTDQDFEGIIYGDVSGNWSSMRQQSTGVARSTTNEVTVQLGEVTPLPKYQFLIPVRVDGTSDLLAAELTITFDHEVLNFQELRLGEMMKGYSVDYYLDHGELKLALAGTYPIISATDLVLIKFQTVDHEVKSPTTIELQQMMLNEGLTRINLVNNQLSINPSIPLTMELFQNYPNPFNSTTSITYQLAGNGRVILKVFNALGQEVKTLVNEIKGIGTYTVSWDGENDSGIKVPSSIYFYRLEFYGAKRSTEKSFTRLRKMILLN